MEILISALRFIWVLFLVLMVFNLMIVVHEWGHFLAGRWRGLVIDRFQIWFGKPIWKKTYNGVQYGLGTIPFGGFVSLPQMAPMEAIEGDTSDEVKKEPLPPISPLDKIIVAFAGPLFSFLLAVFFAVIVWAVGKPVPDEKTAKVAGYVFDDSPAAEAGIKAGDEILSVDGQPVQRIHGMIESVDWYVISSEKEVVDFKVKRDGQEMTLPVKIPRGKTEEEKEEEAKRTFLVKVRDFVFKRTPLPHIGLFGRETPRVGKVTPFSPAEEAGLKPGDLILAIDGTPTLHSMQVSDYARKKKEGDAIRLMIERDGNSSEVAVYPRLPEKRPKELDYPLMGIAWDTFGKGDIIHPSAFAQVSEALTMMKGTLTAIASPKSNVNVTHLSSAVGIMRLYYRLFEHPDGWQLVLWFSVILNVNLAVLNLLPFPVLDGGHIVMSLLEMIRRKPVNLRVLEVVQTTAVVLLLGLMVMLVFKDVGDIAADSTGGSSIEFLPKDATAEPAKAP
ncbi:MAG: site-2 protease family protein [Verrucomicrobiae bacterium]|nr:site-2 protease family protein [Verrucomicrobiae bacterium]